MTRLAARLGALLAPVPGRPSLAETASQAMFSLVGAPALDSLPAAAGTTRREDAVDRTLDTASVTTGHAPARAPSNA